MTTTMVARVRTAAACAAALPGCTCDGDEYCDYDDPQCGIADGGGSCRARPTVCPEIYAPVMGSDGQVYPNACDAHGHGADDCGPAPTP